MGHRIVARVLALGLLLTSAAAHAQLSGVTNNSGSAVSTNSCSAGNNGDGFCGFSTSFTAGPTATSFTSRYAWNINADTGIGGTRDSNGTATHRVGFTVTSATGYKLDISTQFVGDLARNSDAIGCNGAADISSVTGSSNVANTGNLSIPDPATLGNGGGTTDVPFNPTASAQIVTTAAPSGRAHVLTFTWTGTSRSNSCEASVRLGQTNGSTSGCSVCGYPGSPSRTQANDGHFVSVLFTNLCGNNVVDAGSGEQCDLGGQNGSAAGCCSSTCTFRSEERSCRERV